MLPYFPASFDCRFQVTLHGGVHYREGKEIYFNRGEEGKMRPARFERATTCSEDRYSDPLSYGRMMLLTSTLYSFSCELSRKGAWEKDVFGNNSLK